MFAYLAHFFSTSDAMSLSGLHSCLWLWMIYWRAHCSVIRERNPHKVRLHSRNFTIGASTLVVSFSLYIVYDVIGCCIAMCIRSENAWFTLERPTCRELEKFITRYVPFITTSLRISAHKLLYSVQIMTISCPHRIHHHQHWVKRSERFGI